MKFIFKITAIALAGLLAFNYFAMSQPAPVKWGKYSKDEIVMTSCSYDKEATAVVLCEYGNINLSGGLIKIYKQVRIKILDDKGLSYANVSLPYWNKDNLEEIVSVKAQTANFYKNKKAEIDKVDSKQIFTADLDENWKAKKFTLPNVKTGSIIEYQYTVISKNYTFLDDWIFQSPIPTLHSELRANIPETLDYRLLMTGKRLSQKYNGNPTSMWALDNLPALKDEPFCYNKYDFAEKIRFQLAGYTKHDPAYTGVEYVNLMKTWEQLSEEVLSQAQVQFYLNRRGYFKDILELLKVSGPGNNSNNLEKIYNYVKDNYNWNGHYRIFPKQSFGDFKDGRSGNSAELNLFLTGILQEAGFDAKPMLLSTRSNGRVSKAYPLLSQFNHIICFLDFGGKKYFIDTTDPERPLDLPAVEDLTEEGFVLDSKNPFWEKINIGERNVELFSVNLNLAQDTAQCAVYMEYSGYKALETRKMIKNDQQAPEKFLALNNARMQRKNLKIDKLDSIDENLKIAYRFTLTDEGSDNPNFIYLDPVLIKEFEDNPFHSENRDVPIEFPYEQSFIYSTTIFLPEGYSPDGLPESASYVLPGNVGKFIYQCAKRGNSIQLSIRISIDRKTIPKIMFKTMNEFYSLVMEKLGEQIVLKKI